MNFPLPDAGVMEYFGEMEDEKAGGAFYLHIKRKKDKIRTVFVKEGYSYKHACRLSEAMERAYTTWVGYALLEKWSVRNHR